MQAPQRQRHPAAPQPRQRHCNGRHPKGVSTWCESVKTDGVARVAHRRGHCLPFWPIFPPLQVAPSFACSVASLNQCPGHQLPGYCSLHRRTLADYQLGWGRPSTWLTGHTGAPSSSNTLFPRGDRRVDTPSEEKGSRAYNVDYE